VPARNDGRIASPAYPRKGSIFEMLETQSLTIIYDGSDIGMN
jgi:hypothetical protein